MTADLGVLAELWPTLAGELEHALTEAGEPELAAQVPALPVVRRCPCGDTFCQSFSTAPPPAGGYRGAGHRTLELRAPWPGNLLVDVTDREITQVEVLYRSPLD